MARYSGPAPRIAVAWGLPAGVHLVSGEVGEVERTLNAWQVAYRRDRQSGEVEHARIAYLVGPDGRLAYRFEGGGPLIEQGIAELSRRKPGGSITPASGPALTTAD